MRTALLRPALVGLFLTNASLPTTAAAQAWLPSPGEASVTVTYQGLFSRAHLDLHGEPFDRGRVDSNTLVTGFEYGLTDLLAFDAKVAFVANRHQGTDRLHGPLDTGLYHGTIQDARLALAFRVPTGGSFAVAPYVAGILPTHDYETRGHSAPGRRLKALQLGAWAGRDLGRILPRAYLQGHYGFAFVEHIEDMSINRSQLDLEAGYGISRFLTVTVAAAIQRTHGGLDFPLPRDEHFDEVFPFHDRVARDNYFLMNIGATVQVTRAMAIYGSVVRTIRGQNTHHVTGLLLGTSWGFGDGLSLGATTAAASKPPSRVADF